MAATIQIDFNAQLARFTGAIDKATSDLNRFESNAHRVSRQISSAFAGLGVGISIAGIAAVVKQSIDAADTMRDLAIATGVSVKSLASYELAARQAGTSIESVSAAMGKLSIWMQKNAEDAAKLGVTARDPAKALAQFADALVGIENPGLRNAVAMEALGKSYREMLPLLSQGGDALRAQAQASEAYATKMAAMADQADEFNDNLAAMKQEVSAVSIALAGPMVTSLNAAFSAAASVRQEFGALGSAQIGLGQIGTVGQTIAVVWANVAFVLKGVGTEIGGIAAQLGAIGSGRFRDVGLIGDAMKRDAAAARAEFDALEKRIMNFTPEKASGTAKIARQSASYDLAAAAAADTHAKAQARAAKAIAEAEKALRAKIAIQNADFDQMEAFENARIERDEKLAKAAGDLFEAQERLREEDEKRVRALYESVTADRESLDALRIRNDLLAQGIDSQAAYTLALLEAKLASADFAKATWEEIDALQQRIEIARQAVSEEGRGERIKSIADEARKAEDEWRRASQDIERTLSDALMRGFEDGKDWARNFADSLKNLFATLVLRPIIQPIATAGASIITGALGMGASPIASAGGFGNALSSVGNLASLGSNIGTMAGYYGGMAGFGAASQGAMLAAQTAEFGLAGITATAEALGGSMASGFAAALGPVGLALGGIALLASLFGSRGGPKIGAEPIANAAGSLTTRYTLSGGDAFNAEALTAATAQAVTRMADLFGVKVGESFRIGLMYDLDPAGDAPGRVGYRVNEREVRWEINGQDVQAGATALGEAAAQAIVAGLASLDLPGSLEDIVAGFDPTQDIQAALQGLAQLVDAFEVLGRPVDDLTQGLLDAAGGIAALQTDLAAYYQAFYSDEERLAKTSAALGEAFGELNLAMPESKATFRELVDGLDLTTEAGQKTFATLLNLAPTFAQVADATEQAAQQMADAAEQAAESARRTAEAVASERYGLETRLLQAQGNTVALQARELSALDPSNRIIQQQIWAIESAAEAEGKAAEARQAAAEQRTLEFQRAAELEAAAQAERERVAAQRYGIETRLLELQGDTAALRERELMQLDASNKALQEQVWALEDQTAAAQEQARAAEQLQQAWRSLGDALADEVKRIRGLIAGSTGKSLSALQTAFAVKAAQAGAGDQEAARLLPQVSQEMLRVAETLAGSRLDLQRLQARTAATLDRLVAGLTGEYAIPAFADGGLHIGGLRLVGETGPELEATGPARLYNADQMAELLRGGDMAAELRALRAEVAQLRADNSAENRAIAIQTGKTARLVERVIPDGDALAVRTAA